MRRDKEGHIWAARITGCGAGGVAQPIEYLFCKHEALSSNAIPPKNKTNQNNLQR
jgi:hypothetical protein